MPSETPIVAERSVRLDPLGVYGTRSARRRHQMQRRRQVQNGLLWLVGLLVVGGAGWWLWKPHPTSLRANWSRDLPFRPASPPLVMPDGSLYLASQSGGLWRVFAGASPSPSQVKAASRPLFATAFAPGASLLAADGQIFWPGADGTFLSLNARSGAKIWQHNLPSTLVTRPALLRLASLRLASEKAAPIAPTASNSLTPPHTELSSAPSRMVVAVGDDEGNVAAFDARSGTVLWQRGCGGAAGEAIVALDGEKPAFLVPLLAGAASRGGLLCLDARSGAQRWRFPTGDNSQSGGLAAPATLGGTLGGRVYWCNDEGAVVCLDAATGRKIWKTFAVPAAESASGAGASKRAATDAGTTVVAASGAQKSNLGDGDSNSENSGAEAGGGTLISLRGAPTVVAGAKIVAVGGNDGILRAFDLDSGAARWHLQLSGTARFAAQSLIFEGRHALLCSGNGPVIFLVDASDGRVLRRWTTPFGVDFGVVAVGSAALALDAEGHLQGATLR